jgi:thioester reductase-like protein
VFENPSIEALAKATLDAVFGQADSDEYNPRGYNLEHVLEECVAQLPEPSGLEPELELPTEDIKVVLLGSRGRLGPYIVRDLLDDPRVAGIKCLDRGGSGQAEFQRRADELGIDVDASNARLQFISMELSHPNLGLSQNQMDEILNHADVIIHNVWAVNFALSLSSFKPEMLKSLSTVIEIANKAPSRPRIVFASSTGTVSAWAKAVAPNVPVPEEVIKCASAATLTGYAQSKHVAERLLATAGAKLKIPISILRIGQIAGPTTIGDGGKWESHDWMHSLAILSKACGLVPSDVAEIDWVPVDQVSRIVSDITLQEKHEGETGTPFVQLYNILHPRPIQFSVFADALQSCISSSRQVGFHAWVDHLAGLTPDKLSKEAEAEKTRILPFFQAIVEEQYPKFTLEKAKKASAVMAEMEPIDQELLTKWCQQWTKT